VAHSAFRFVQASDFHLEELARGLAEVPDHLRDLLLDLPYRAAQQVFDVALREEVDFVVLPGNLLQIEQAGPRGPLFLHEQFERLAARQIAVYWASGPLDPPDTWPAWLDLPRNVHVFAGGRVEEVLYQRGGLPVARLMGMGGDGRQAFNPAHFEQLSGDLYTVAVVHGAADAATLRERQVDYWALGGRRERTTLFSAPHIAHYAGTPQGRGPEETEAHGCTLVQVDDRGQTRTSFVPCEALRWSQQRVAIDGLRTRDDLEQALRRRLAELAEAAPQTPLVVAWTVSGAGPLAGPLRSGTLAAEMLNLLRGDAGFATPPRWSAALEVEPTTTLPAAWYDEDSIRGDFLRAVRHFEMNPQEPIDLAAYLDPRHAAGLLGDAVAVNDPVLRQRVLREAALLGVDLLSGEEA